MSEFVPIEGRSTHPEDMDYIRTNIPCQWACPAFTSIPAYIEAVYRGDCDGAYRINRRSNLFPGVLGRICTRPCETACRHGDSDLGEPVSICHIKRVSADHKSNDHVINENLFAPTGKTVGVIGAGPAGLAIAHSLAIFGHQVTIYESLEHAGGMLAFGIPAFRLPRTIIRDEVFNVLRQGITLQTGVTLGDNLCLSDLLKNHDATVIAAGCQVPRSMDVPGEDLPGVYSGLDFMMQVNRGSRDCVGRRVVVVGGGFTAIDCCRSARRMGAEEIYVAIRGVEEDLTVPEDEVREIYREGIRFLSLVSVMRVEGDESVTGIRFVRNRFGGIRGSSGRSVITIEGSEFSIEVDTVIAAIGQTPLQSLTALEGAPVTFDKDTGSSGVHGLFGAGDYIRKASTVIEAIGSGRRVAENIDEFLVGRRRRAPVVSVKATADTHRKRVWDFIERHDMPALNFDDRLASQDAEVETGFTKETGLESAKRCYLCNLKYEVHIPDCIYCRWCIDICPRNCIELVENVSSLNPARIDSSQITRIWNKSAAVVIDSDRCIRCGECLRVCPTRCIHVSRIELSDECLTMENPS